MVKPDTAETIVSQGMRIEGELKSSGSIRIDGLVSGKIHTAHDLTVGPNAQIDADLIAANATIAGVVKGNITVKGALAILGSGKVIGNLSCQSLSINDGAYFSGACKMSEPKLNPEPEK